MRRFIRFLMVFLALYVVWSICIDVCGLDHKVGDESLVPCLFFLPPAGFLILLIILFKLAESVVFLRFVKMVRNLFCRKSNTSKQ